MLTNEEQLAAVSAKKPKPAVEPMTMKMVQTPVDGQSKEVAREQMRKAAGAEGMHTASHSGLDILEQLRQRQQQPAPRDDEFSSDPWALLRREP